MRITVGPADLCEAVTAATTAMRGGKKLVRLVAHDNGASVIGADKNMAIEIPIAATVEAAGEVVLDAGRLAGLADNADGDLVMSSTDTSVNITCGRGQYRIPVLSDPPTTLVLGAETGRVEISVADVTRLLEPLPAASAEASRFYLSGLLWQSEPGHLTSVATDGNKLLRVAIEAAHFSDDRRLIIPSKSALAIGKLVRGDGGMITLRRDRRLLSVSGSSFTATTSLLDFVYPDLTSVLPAPSAHAAIVARADLARSVARLLAVATGEVPALLVIEWFGPGPLHLYLAGQPDDGSDLVEAEVAGQAQIAVAPKPLALLLDQFSDETLRIEITNRLAIHSDGKLAVLASCAWNFTPRTSPGASVRANKGAGKQQEKSNENV
jgi:DNA polymerase-3 subunit beta